MIDENTLKGRLVAAAMRLAAQKPWADVTLAEIAEAAGVGLVELKAEVSGKTEIIAAFVGMVDDEMLRRAPRRSVGEAPRDALFEVVMSRFDLLQPYKAAVRSIMHDAAPDPRLVRAALSSQKWMLAAAGIGTDGVGGAVRLAGLASVYAAVSRTWLDDEDPGLARTMASLDRRLRSGERTLSTIDGVIGNLNGLKERFASRRSPAPQPPPPTDVPPAPAPPEPSPSI